MCYTEFLSGQKHSCSQVLEDIAPFFGSVLLSWNIKLHMKPQTYLLHNLQKNEGEVNDGTGMNKKGKTVLLQAWCGPEGFRKLRFLHS